MVQIVKGEINWDERERNEKDSVRREKERERKYDERK